MLPDPDEGEATVSPRGPESLKNKNQKGEGRPGAKEAGTLADPSGVGSGLLCLNLRTTWSIQEGKAAEVDGVGGCRAQTASPREGFLPRP